MANSIDETLDDNYIGYNGLIIAVIKQAAKEYKKAYIRLSNDLSIENYGFFITERLFFINNCNGYIGVDLANYIYNKLNAELEEKVDKKKYKKTNKYIELMDSKSNN